MTKKGKLLLLSCCAPCSIGVIKTLATRGVDFTVLFYNPNIQPLAEYDKRCQENKQVCEKLGVPFVELPYDPEVWRHAVLGLENEPERGKRCDKCFKLRLLKTAKYAKENGFTHFSSVLGISRHKDMDQVNRMALQVAGETGVPYDDTNWRKDGIDELRKILATEFNLYRQDYCGCKPR